MYQGESTTRTIDGEDYTSQPHYGEKNLYYFAQFVKLFTEPLANLILGFIDSGAEEFSAEKIMEADLDWKAIADGVINLSNQLTPQEYVDLVKGFLAQTRFNGKVVSEHFDTLFAGRILLVHKLLTLALEVNFADFLSLAKDKQQSMKSKKVSS